MILRSVLDGLASVIFAAHCRIFGDILSNASRIAVCETCLAGSWIPGANVAAGLSMAPLTSQTVQPLCRLCRVNFYAFQKARSFAIYDDTLSEAIVLLKYEEVTRLGQWFAERLTEIVLQAPEQWRADV